MKLYMRLGCSGCEEVAHTIKDGTRIDVLVVLPGSPISEIQASIQAEADMDEVVEYPTLIHGDVKVVGTQAVIRYLEERGEDSEH